MTPAKLRALVAKMDDPNTDWCDRVDAFAEAKKALPGLLDRLDAAEMDAARYRWIRRSDTPSMEVIARKTDEYGVELYFGDELDAAIDAARAKVGK